MFDFYNSKTVTTRKPHKCELCRIKIEPKTQCHYESGKFEGDFFSRYTHNECSEEWARQNSESEQGDEWGWFEDECWGSKKEWKEKIQVLYNLRESQ